MPAAISLLDIALDDARGFANARLRLRCGPVRTRVMSYHARMTKPLLIVTGRGCACGNTKRTAQRRGSRSSVTIGTKSKPSAPSPCSQMTLPVAGTAGFSTTASALSREVYAA